MTQSHITLSPRGVPLITMNCSLRGDCWLNSKYSLPCLWYRIVNFINVFLYEQQSKKIFQKICKSNWRLVVSSDLWAQSGSKGFATCLPLRQLYSESHFKYKGGSEFLTSHWKKRFLSLALPHLDFPRETLLDQQEVSLSAVEMPGKLWEEHTRSIYKVKLFQVTMSSIPIPIFHTACICNIWKNIFLMC